MPTIRAIMFWIGFNFSTIFVTTLLTISFILPFSIRFKISRLWPMFNLWWLNVTCGLKYEIHGLDNIPDTAVIFMSKHQSTWETLTFQKFMPPMVWVLKRELLWIPIFGWGVAMLKPIAINRSQGRKALKQLIDQGRARLQEGISVMIFPEGTRTDFGSDTQYRAGGATLASHSGYPVIPIAHNAGYYWPRHEFHKKPGTIKVVIGKPIETKDKTSHEIIHEVKEWIENEMVSISKDLPH